MTNPGSKIHSSWLVKLQNEFNSPYFENLSLFLKEEMNTKIIYPNKENIFEAFNQTYFENVKVVIMGQDPYHGINQAHGLSFSVQDGTTIPPSLKNIFRELNSDLNIKVPKSGNLSKWAKEGVLLLNSILTVKAKTPRSHQKIGWEKFTNAAIKALSDERENIVFILWGKYAQDKESLINSKKHYILKSAHPSPFSAQKGFFGSKPFSKSNNYLQSSGISTVNWSLSNS
ncbi:MAG: uracil-DNA glycosylase [Flavobacteriales bacterium]|nr:uracil-DNA glycosylase [Flavobacteriales bacterium]|tara:strand:- start:27987 stop:28673 length:687 start_codon:yes stop_codon:yes gene_type:complete